ncbi:protease complex subunit PrcB family protein [Anaerobacillus sp. CMMVII]|uniref:protease complex subunit PrcB family protein n=1 Tax=Anaerobacillus sp. CMMVII TaxID=2755588 RepID=UPI0021B70D41|nr:protease complex subunit PrcB family protein [Anaerobacillus sp. CMMVII]MCT8140229.1 protease complex subunit PrcB family protein [Anaerobacillus sp. CMMVII]
MRRHLLWLLFTMLIVTGCGQGSLSPDNNLGEPEAEEENPNEKGEEEVMNEGNIPFELLTTQEIMASYPQVYKFYTLVSNKDISDYRIYTENGYEIIAVSTGLKPTGGYRIEVAAITNVDGKTVISLEEYSPPEGALVTQALVNPTIFILLAKEKIFDDKIILLDGSPFEIDGGTAY